MLMEAPRFVRTDTVPLGRGAAIPAQRRGLRLRAFARQREETLQLLRGPQPEDWRRTGVHVGSRGRRSIDEFLTVIAWHDDNHLDQLRRALQREG